jgi:hypothetical protein
MAAAAAARVSRLFTIPAMVEGTLATYERAIRSRQSSVVSRGTGKSR